MHHSKSSLAWLGHFMGPQLMLLSRDLQDEVEVMGLMLTEAIAVKCTLGYDACHRPQPSSKNGFSSY